MPAGNFTMVQNWVFDSVMKTTSNAEFKIFCTVYRLTEGFNKKRDLISYDQFEDRTGMARATVAAAVLGLQAKELISKTKRGYAINYAQIVQKLDSPASKNKIVQNLNSPVQNLDSDSSESELINRAQTVQNLDSQNIKDSFKKTPASKDTDFPATMPAAWQQAGQELLLLGIDGQTVIELLELAKRRNHEPEYISRIAGYVVLPDAGAKSPAKLAITLIRRNLSRSPETPPDTLGAPPAPGKPISGQIDWSAPKYQHGGSAHFLMKADCPICQKDRKFESSNESE